MLKLYFLIFISFFYAVSIQAAGAVEYNKWYKKNGVLFDVTQTNDNNPVMISIYAENKDNANMVVSYYSHNKCESNISTLKIDDRQYPIQYLCMPRGQGKINSYIFSDSASVNHLVDRLRSGFTLLIQDNIKVWVENFNHPEFGIFPSN